MQSDLVNRQQDEVLENNSQDISLLTDDDKTSSLRSFLFRASFVGCMDMYSDIDTVADYLDAHEGWFCRCARPMKVEPLGNNGYILVIGRFGSLGFQVEPKIAVVLEPPVDRVYQMRTIPIPDGNTLNYDVNYQASMKLEASDPQQDVRLKASFLKKRIALPRSNTKVFWSLNLAVNVRFPKFINKFSPSLVQSTGDRLIAQIVRQVSPRLTYKVQQDFHTRLGLPVPPKNSLKFEQISCFQ
ncbi:DUF1997 domain-containing protein [Myxosarcina sp. GI1]|uniref:DUF1997 domain-containing protein n=1 Tax=Myxosarcina sp. GI1 TaxID=1541065 RepID=UPI00055D0936|nr:DUF1997 domain-containing protein [Myxosarcina sp. GI1]